MFEASDAPTFDNDEGRQKKPKTVINWSIYTIDELIRFRDEIDQKLPPKELKDMDLEHEMLLQFHTLRALQAQALSDDEFPLNQRVALANSVSASLAKMTESQNALYSSERFKKIENLLIRHLNKLPEETAAAFIREYEALLRSLNG